MDQVCFTGESLCQSFAGHTLKANMCTGCMKDVAKHKKESVTEEELIKVRMGRYIICFILFCASLSMLLVLYYFRCI